MFIRMTTNKKSNQKGGVKEHVLISSCKITKIKTRCWTTINRRMLELTKKKKKKHLMSKDKVEATGDSRRGTITIK